MAGLLRSHATRIALIASLALNVVLLAAAIFILPPHGPPPPGPSSARMMDDIGGRLSSAGRGALGAAYARHRPRLETLEQEILQARRQVRDALEGERFDVELFRSMSGTLSERVAAWRRGIEQVLLEALPLLSADDRHRFADLGPR
jgi:uncharacterized membrane protein